MEDYLFESGITSLTLLLAACGGGTPPPPSSITLTVEDPQGDFNAAAYQVGSGPWQTLSMSGSSTKTATFNLGSESKYGVAVRCGDGEVMVIQATNGELANPKLVCSTVPFTVNVSIDSGLPLANGDQVCVNNAPLFNNYNNCQTVSANASITLNLEPGTRDLLITLTDNSGLVKVAKVQRNVNVSNGGNTTVSLGPGDQRPPVSFNTPAGSTAARVFYLSGNNTAFGTLHASPTSYRPVAGFGGGDRYVAAAFALPTNGQLFTFQAFSSGFPSLSLPAPWTAGALTVQQTAHPSISGLNRTENDLQGYSINLYLRPSGFSYAAMVSKVWLGTATSYTLPDLSSQLSYIPSSGSDYSFSNGTLLVRALLSNKGILGADLLANVFTLADRNYLKVAEVNTYSYEIGGGEITLP